MIYFYVCILFNYTSISIHMLKSTSYQVSFNLVLKGLWPRSCKRELEPLVNCRYRKNLRQSKLPSLEVTFSYNLLMHDPSYI